MTSGALCIAVSHRWLRIAETWFGSAKLFPTVDLLVARQWKVPMARGDWHEKHTLIVDLSAPEPVRLARCSKDTQYQIRRAGAKDGLVASLDTKPTPAVRQRFADFYDRFAALKALPPVDRAQLDALADVGALALSHAHGQDQELVWHSYVCSAGRARLLHSASQHRGSSDSGFRSLVGRANRWLHWQDMNALADSGCAEYDFGGWYAGATDSAKLKINEFKQEFGGAQRCEYDGTVALTWRGQCYLWLRRCRTGAA